MTIYNLSGFLTGFVEAFMIFMLYNTFLQKRNCLPTWVYVLGVVALTFMINLSNILFDFGMLNVFAMILFSFAMSFLYKGKTVVKATISVLAFLIMVVIEIAVMFSITLIYKITVAEAVNNLSYRLLGTIVSKALALLIVNIIRLNFKKKSLYMGASYWILFLLMFISSTITVFLIFRLSYGMNGTYMYNISIICSLGLMLSTFFALYLYEHLAMQNEIIQNQKQYEHNLKEQIKHLDEIVITQNQIKKFKHDFLNYEIGLKSYLKNQDCDGAINYLNSLSGNLGNSENIIETGNSALDAILSAKKVIAETKGISFTTQIQIPQKLDVAPTDMCIIFGNAIDNAIEACEKIKHKRKKIDLTLICQDKRLFCKIVNSTAERTNGILKTSKSDAQNHGFGLENIRTSLAKYNSEPTITQTDDEFAIKFIIFTK